MRNHDLVSLGDNFINSYRQDLNFAFPFRVQEPKTVACSSKWAEGQVKTPHMHKQSCTSRFGAWSGSTPPLSLWTPLRFRSWPEGRGWIPILFGGRNAGWSAYHFTQSSAVRVASTALPQNVSETQETPTSRASRFRNYDEKQIRPTGHPWSLLCNSLGCQEFQSCNTSFIPQNCVIKFIIQPFRNSFMNVNFLSLQDYKLFEVNDVF